MVSVTAVKTKDAEPGKEAKRHARKPRAKKLLTKKIVGADEVQYIKIFGEDPLQRVAMIKHGIPAIAVKTIAGDLKIDQRMFLHSLNLKTATVNRKIAKKERLPADESERVAGVASLVGQVEAMVAESGNPVGFNAAEWLSHWLREPLPAFGGRMPITLLDTMEGQRLVSQALSWLQSGVYA